MAAEKTSKNATSKADFVRAHGDLSTKEVVAKAKAEGITLAENYIYRVRGYDKTKRKAMKLAARRATARTAPSVARPITTASKTEDLLRAVAAEVGLAKAIEMLQAQRGRVHAVLRG